MSVRARSLRLWARESAENIGLGIVIAVVITFFQTVGSGVSGLENGLSLLGSTVIGIGALITLFVSMGNFLLYLPIQVSMNRKRRDVVWFSTSQNLAISGVFLLMAIVLWKISGDELAQSSLNNIPVYVGMLLAASGFGSLMGTLNQRFGKVMKVIFSIICGLIGACVGMFMAISMDGEVMARISGFLAGIITNPWLVGGIGAVLFAVSVVASHFLVHNYEVQM